MNDEIVKRQTKLMAIGTKWRLRAVCVALGCAVIAAGCVLYAYVWVRERRVPDVPRKPAARLHDYIIQGYYPYWAVSSAPPAVIAFEELTHVSHAFVWPKADGRLHVPRTFDAGGLMRYARAAGCTVLLCVGGGGEGSAHFRGVASNAAARAAFVDTVCAFAQSNGYDGIEVNWEFPRSAMDASNLVALVQMLRERLGRGAVVSVTVNGSHYSGEYIDVAALDALVDFFPVMTYDYHGRWSAQSGHNAPLLAYEGSDGDVQSGVTYWLKRGMPARKIVLGLPFYGRTFDTDGIGRAFKASGTKPYREIAPLVGQGYERRWDMVARVPYLVAASGVNTISYDDLVSLSLKVDYAKEQGFGGVMIWHVAGDVVGGRHRLLPGVAGRVRGALLLAGPVEREEGMD